MDETETFLTSAKVHSDDFGRREGQEEFESLKDDGFDEYVGIEKLENTAACGALLEFDVHSEAVMKKKSNINECLLTKQRLRTVSIYLQNEILVDLKLENCPCWGMSE